MNAATLRSQVLKLRTSPCIKVSHLATENKALGPAVHRDQLNSLLERSVRGNYPRMYFTH